MKPAAVVLALLPVVSLPLAVWCSLAFAGVCLVVAIWRGVRS